MSKKLVISEFNEDKIISMLFEDNKETRIDVTEKKDCSLIDNVYVGLVKDVVAPINAAFILIEPEISCFMALNEGQSPVFLNKKNTDKVCQGDKVLVQVTKEASKNKAPSVTGNINLAGQYAALVRDGKKSVGVSRKIKNNDFIMQIKEAVQKECGEDYGFIIRTEAMNVSLEMVMEDVKKLKEQYENLIKKAQCRTLFSKIYEAPPEIVRNIISYKLTEGDEIITDDKGVADDLNNRFPHVKIRLYKDALLPLKKLYSIDKRLNEALRKNVWLKSGGFIVIEQTEALTVIDVNTGKFDGRLKDRDKTFLKINLEAAAEIARQLILRNVSGIIIVDFINMSNRDYLQELGNYFSKILSEDFVHADFVGFTRLGLAEVTRKKAKKPLCEQMKGQEHEKKSFED